MYFVYCLVIVVVPWPVADLHSKILDASGSKFLQFHGIFGGNFVKSYVGAPWRVGGLDPPLLTRCRC